MAFLKWTCKSNGVLLKKPCHEQISANGTVLRLDVKVKHLRFAMGNLRFACDEYCNLFLELEKLRLSYCWWTEVRYKFSRDPQILVGYRTSVSV